MAEPLQTEDQSSASGFQYNGTGEALAELLVLADSALQPGEAATPAQGALASTAVQPATLTALGNAADITIAPVDSVDRAYTANLTGSGTLTVTAAAAGKYAACLLRLTSSADGTNVLAPPAGVRWADGIAVSLAPRTDQVIALYVQSIDGTLVLSVSTDRVPA